MHLRQIVIALTVSILRKGIPVMAIVTIANYILGKRQMMGSVGALLERSDWYDNYRVIKRGLLFIFARLL